MRIYNAEKASAQTSYEAQRAAFLNEQSEFNRSVDQLQMDVEKGSPSAVASLANIALAYLEMPDEIELDFDIQYHAQEKLVVLSGILPGLHAVPRAIRYEYHGEENRITPVEMDKASFDNYYESTLLQITFSVVHSIFTAIPDRQIHTVVFNGLIGDGESCILTCKVSRELFDSIDLGRNALNESFQAMQGIMVKPLAGLTPVEPLIGPASTASQSPSTAGVISQPDGPHQPAAYQPGEIKNAANNLLIDLLDQIEKDLNKQPGNNDVVH
jgi:restriction system protein